MIARGRSGIYAEKLIDSIPRAMRDRYLVPIEEKGARAFQMDEDVRGLVRFNELNLLGSWPMRAKFDLIFCRNVMIYFDEPTQNSIWARFAECLVPQGPLFIGHSERIATETQPFDLVAQTTYRLRGRT
jgi:chemotaxis protein methyltransferase CheR